MYDHWSLIHPCSKFMLYLKGALASWYWFGYGYWSLVHQYAKFWLSILILKAQRTSMSFKSSFGALEDAGGSWLGFGILILIWIWSLDFDIPMFQILALYLDFEVAKNIYVLLVMIGALEDDEGSWLEFGILRMIWIWSLVFNLALALGLGSSFWLGL